MTIDAKWLSEKAYELASIESILSQSEMRVTAKDEDDGLGLFRHGWSVKLTDTHPVFERVKDALRAYAHTLEGEIRDALGKDQQ